MKKQLIGMVLMAGLLTSCGSLNPRFVQAVDYHASEILPEYKYYVTKDPGLSEESKWSRLESADHLRRIIDKAKRQIE